MTYEYDAELVRVIDGDTVVLKLWKEYDFGFHIIDRKTYEGSFRLMGIDTPELRGVNADLIPAKKARDRLHEILSLSKRIRAVTYKPDKYGRWLVDLFIDDSNGDSTINVNEMLLNEGLATKY
jgi:endonuclease YncB( thermonuclease family)